MHALWLLSLSSNYCRKAGESRTMARLLRLVARVSPRTEGCKEYCVFLRCSTLTVLCLATLHCVGVLAWPPSPCVLERGTADQLVSIGVVLFPMRQGGRNVFVHFVLPAVAGERWPRDCRSARTRALPSISRAKRLRVGSAHPYTAGPPCVSLTRCATPSHSDASRTADAQVGDAKIFTHEKQSRPCPPAILHTKNNCAATPRLYSMPHHRPHHSGRVAGPSNRT